MQLQKKAIIIRPTKSRPGCQTGKKKERANEKSGAGYRRRPGNREGDRPKAGGAGVRCRRQLPSKPRCGGGTDRGAAAGGVQCRRISGGYGGAGGGEGYVSRGRGRTGTGGGVGKQRRNRPAQRAVSGCGRRNVEPGLCRERWRNAQHDTFGAAAHAARETGQHCQYLLDLGPARRFLRGGLRLHKGRGGGPDAFSGAGAGAVPYSGERSGPRLYRHGHGSFSGPGNDG